MKTNVYVEATLATATAIDGSGTLLGYGDCVNRDGVKASDIGNAVLSAIDSLAVSQPGYDEDIECITIIVRFQHST